MSFRYDYLTVRCYRFREAASAAMDGEPLGMPQGTLQAHLGKCRSCAEWVDTAESLTRAARIATADVPDLGQQIAEQAVLPVRSLLRLRRALQIALVLTAFGQIGLAVPELFGRSIGMAMSAHMSHESASFNIAVGIGLLAVVLRPIRASGMLPLMTAIVVVLFGLSIPDVVHRTVNVARLATHLTTVLGLVLLFAMSRLASDDPLDGDIEVDDLPSSAPRLGGLRLSGRSSSDGDSGAQPGIRGVA